MKDCIHFDVCKFRIRNKECIENCSCYKSIDVVKVVRCKDCKNKTEIDHKDGRHFWFCEHWKGYPKVEPMGYCYFGERE